MRALRVHGVGEPADVLVLEEVAPPNAPMLRGLRMSLAGWVAPGTPGAAPTPSDDWVIVNVSMAALALPDVTMARGTYPVPVPRPYTTGQEGVGVVVEAGPPHQHLVGKRIAACMIQPFGSLAETAVGVGMMVEVSPDMSDAEAAALMIPAHTGYHTVIRRGAVTAGELVAVRGAAGGLGAACVQLARAVGAHVVAIVGGTDAVNKAEFCRSLGAADVIDHTHGDVAGELIRLTGGRGVDVIIDPVQGADATAVRAGLRVGGRHVLCGHAGGLPPIDPHFYLQNHTLVGVTLGGYGPDEMRRMHAETQAAIEQLIASGAYRSTPTRVIGFEDVPAALTDLAARRTMGRIVVQCSPR
jgi:NADPH2:quinone reductase